MIVYAAASEILESLIGILRLRSLICVDVRIDGQVGELTMAPAIIAEMR